MDFNHTGLRPQPECGYTVSMVDAVTSKISALIQNAEKVQFGEAIFKTANSAVGAEVIIWWQQNGQQDSLRSKYNLGGQLTSHGHC